MIVKMLMGHIRHHRDVKITGNHPALMETVGGGFKHAILNPPDDHLTQVGLDIRCIRRGDVKPCIQNFIPNHGIDGGDHADLLASVPQNFVKHGGSGCFAIRPGHPNHAQMAGWKAL